MSRERVVKTFFGVSSPPDAVKAENTRNMRIVRDTIMKPRLEPRTIPPWRMMWDSLLSQQINKINSLISRLIALHMVYRCILIPSQFLD